MFKRAFALVGISAVVSLIAAPAVLAWHPKGVIDKKVQNVTQSGSLTDADDAASAVTSKPGDVLKYVIEIRNDGAPHQSGYNDMYFVELRDELPTGVELVADPSKRIITENIGLIKAGKKVVREYEVKVVSQTNDQIVENKACFKGDSEVKDSPQSGCNLANIKVVVPKKQEEKKILSSEITIPATGAGSVAAASISLAGVGYGLQAYVRSKKRLNKR